MIQSIEIRDDTRLISVSPSLGSLRSLGVMQQMLSERPEPDEYSSVLLDRASRFVTGKGACVSESQSALATTKTHFRKRPSQVKFGSWVAFQRRNAAPGCSRQYVTDISVPARRDFKSKRQRT